MRNMIERDRKLTPAGVDRRDFIGQLGSVVILAGVTPGHLAAGEDRHLAVGYLYYPWFSNLGGDHRWHQVRRAGFPMPGLGSYSSSDPGLLDTHLSLAARDGMSYFLVSHDYTDPEQNLAISRLFERVESMSTTFKLAVLIQPDTAIRAIARDYERGRISHSRYQSQATDWLTERTDHIAKRWFKSPAYLESSSRQKILGVSMWGAPELTAEVVGLVKVASSDLKNTFIWYSSGDCPSPHEMSAILKDGCSAWVGDGRATKPEQWAAAVTLYRSGNAGVVGLWTDPNDPNSFGARVDAITRLNGSPRHLLVAAFNDWERGIAFEPHATRTRLPARADRKPTVVI